MWKIPSILILLLGSVVYNHAQAIIQGGGPFHATQHEFLRRRNLAEKATKAQKTPKSTKAPSNTSKSTKAPSAVPSPAPSFTPSNAPSVCTNDPRTAAEIRDILLDITDASALDASDTPQNDAYLWLVNEDTYISPCPDDLLQRYIMTTFYYAAGMESHSSFASSWRVPNEDECDWGYSFTVTCDSDRVTNVNLFFQSLQGTIPREFGFLSSLTQLRLTTNNLEGTIPTELGLLESLKYAEFAYSGVTGPIPSEFRRLSNNLITFDASTNHLTGSIPTEFGNLQSLTLLSVSDNELQGTLPSEIGNLELLTYLYVYGNEFTGTIPTELGNLQYLKTLQASDNLLSETILSEVCSLSVLSVLQTDWCSTVSNCCSR